MNIKTHFIWLALLALGCGEGSTPAEKSSEPSSGAESINTQEVSEVKTLSNVEAGSIDSTSVASDSLNVNHGLFPCGSMSPVPYIQEIAAKHSGIPYDNDPTTQTSGIFQRFLGTLREQCPEAKDLTPPNQGLSRDQAKWYYDKQALTTVKDPLKQAELIRPGMVMFFGKKNQEFYSTQPVEKLWSDEGIHHVGIVTDVKRDENGEVESYSLFHGVRSGKSSGITNANKRKSTEKYPSFGYAIYPWVAVAPVVVQ